MKLTTKLFISITFIGSLSAAQHRRLSTVIEEDAYSTHLVHNSLVRNPSRLGKLDISIEGEKFSVIKEGKKIPVNNYDVSPKVRDAVKYKALHAFLQSGHLKVSELTENGNKYYAIDGVQTGKGGGPGLGIFMYGLCKSALYGAVGASVIAGTAGVAVATVASGGTALLPAAGAAGAVTATAAGTAVVAAGAAPAVASATVATVAAGGISGLIFGIEAASFGCGVLFGMAPVPV